MRIALISFEFPPAVAIGGIGAYAYEASRMLALAGHDVEVFAAGGVGEEPAAEFGVRVHRFDVKNRLELSKAVVPVFSERHREQPFDVMESPEIGAEGTGIKAAFPDLPFVVKLHTPSYLVGKVGYEQPTLIEHLRFTLGGLRRGRWATRRSPAYNAELDYECLFTRSADEIAAPSKAIGEIVGRDWKLDSSKVSQYPLPFRPSEALLELPYPSAGKVIGFLGRLEARKGVVELAKAIPEILEKAPDLRFRFLGPSWPYKQGDMESWIRGKCRKVIDRIEFVGAVGKGLLASELGKCDIMILPSRWENFPFACWETMASGRAVIGSASGGMADVIEPGVSGLLVEPKSPKSIVKAILSLANDPEKVARLGKAGRKRILHLLAPERILPLQIASYERAIRRAKEKINGEK